MKEEIKYLRIALAIQHIGLKEIDIEKIIETYEAIKIKGGKLNLRDVIDIETRVEESYKPILKLKKKQNEE